ncbi:PREDICTED: uncharacterized protein LOC107340867 [Acropora digitifera]|uniref:uncharacterized protein LOC107340867 n=1 Tax=Acropora digitifera TaxID=70779 RepID=UPI00077AEFEE|nr:PREDICTED: uncharacterized protein LOC107340867 [Acropora digitifera]
MDFFPASPSTSSPLPLIREQIEKIEYKFGTNIVFQTEIFHRGLTTDTICLISNGRLLHFFPVRVNIPENSGKSIVVKIVVPIVVAAILIIVAVVLYCRYCKPRVYGAPAKSGTTTTFSEDKQVQRSEEEPYYSEIPAEKHDYQALLSQPQNPGYENCDVSLQNTGYQQLHCINGRPEPTYARLKTESVL